MKLARRQASSGPSSVGGSQGRAVAPSFYRSFAGAAIAGAPPMRNAAVKYGATLAPSRARCRSAAALLRLVPRPAERLAEGPEEGPEDGIERS
jgi:hypothetical protein